MSAAAGDDGRARRRRASTPAGASPIVVQRPPRRRRASVGTLLRQRRHRRQHQRRRVLARQRVAQAPRPRPAASSPATRNHVSTSPRRGRLEVERRQRVGVGDEVPVVRPDAGLGLEQLVAPRRRHPAAAGEVVVVRAASRASPPVDSSKTTLNSPTRNGRALLCRGIVCTAGERERRACGRGWRGLGESAEKAGVEVVGEADVLHGLSSPISAIAGRRKSATLS